MGVQLVRVGFGADYVQIFGFVCGIEEVAHCERGIVPIQEYVPVGECGFTGECYQGVFEDGGGEDGKC